MTSLTAELAKPNGILPRNLKLKALLNFAFCNANTAGNLSRFNDDDDGDDDDDWSSPAASLVE